MQRGYTSSGIAFIVIVIAAISFYLGTQYKTTLPKNQSNNQNVSTDSANLSNDPLNIKTSVSSASIEPIQVKAEDLIVSKGVFQYSEHKINYTFSFPKAGGDVKGSLEGVCNGVLTGQYNGGSRNSLSGNFDGSCTAGPILSFLGNENFSSFIKPTVKATYTGDVDKDKGKIYIRYNMTEPSSYLGSFELDIQK